MDWFLYDRDLRHEGVNPCHVTCHFLYPLKASENQRNLQLLPGFVPFDCQKGRYTYDVHENCQIFQSPPPAHLHPKFFHSLDVGRPIPNDLPPPLQMITNQLKENMIQGDYYMLSTK